MLKGFTRKFKPLDILSAEELEAIHRGALNVLETTGVKMEHDGALKMFASNDCKVDFDEKRVRIPASVAEECLRRCPSNYLVKARDRDCDLMVGGDTFYFMQGMGMRYVDLDTWETRPATLQEHKEAMIVADALDNLHMNDSYQFYMELQGIPAVMVMLENLASGIKYSGKSEHFGYQRDCEIFAIKMAQELGIDLEPELDSAAPLTFYKDAVEAVFRYVEVGNPIQPTVSMTMGAEGPATCASTLVLGAAQMMAFVALGQLKKPGVGMSIQTGIKPLDMQRGNPRYGAVSHTLTAAMTNQLLRRYQIPSCTTAGYTSMSKKIDFQCAYERAMPALINALAGNHLQIFHGGSSVELLFHPVLEILDDDVAGWIGRFVQGAEVNDETMAIDLINAVGPIPGHYLSQDHTRKWWKKEQFLPKVADREAYPVWLKTGKKDALTLAKERMEEILATHKPKPLTSAQEQVLEDMLTEARDYYKKNGLISDEEWSVYMKALKLFKK